MLSRAENELLTRVANDAPMGQLVRRYWLPAYRSDDLAAGGAPMRLKLLGLPLVAFRDSAGEVGILDEHCPHRRASLALARNENCALQCLYHGWRINREGQVVEAPTEPENSNFKDRIRHGAYPTREAGGLVWAYLGPREAVPRFPAFEFTTKRADQIYVLRVVERCNWVQALEGVVDSAHIGYLHRDLASRLAAGDDTAYTGGGGLLSNVIADGRPKLEIENTPYGYQYASLRRVLSNGDAARYIRTSHFVAPFFGMFAAPATWGFQQAFVPIDDHTTMFYFIHYRTGDEELPEAEHEHIRQYSAVQTLDSEWRLPYSIENWWGQDRAAMESGASFTGLPGVQVEDFAAQESMGTIVDRSKEHLGTSDIAVIRMRRLLLDGVRKLHDGDPLLAQGNDFDYGAIRAEEALYDLDQPWQTVGRSGQSVDSAATANPNVGVSPGVSQ